jgi:hypothetical protein
MMKRTSDFQILILNKHRPQNATEISWVRIVFSIFLAVERPKTPACLYMRNEPYIYGLK